MSVFETAYFILERNADSIPLSSISVQHETDKSMHSYTPDTLLSMLGQAEPLEQVLKALDKK